MIGNRRGFTLLEATAALALMAAAMVAATQLLAVVARQQHGAVRQRLAAREAANLMERLMARGWDELTPQAATELALSEGAAQELPDARLHIDIEEVDERLRAKRVQVEIDWLNIAGLRCEPVRLVAWKYRTTENTGGSQ